MYVNGNPINYNDPTGHFFSIPYIGNNTTTASGRENDIAFNWLGQEERITGKNGKGGLWGEKSWHLQALDQLILHPTATVHDHFLNEWDKMSNTKQNMIKASYIIGALLINMTILLPSAILFLFPFGANPGSMIPAFFIGTHIGVINLHIWAANQGLAYSKKAWNKLKNPGKTIKSAVSSTNKLVKNVTGSTTNFIKKVTNAVKNAAKKLKRW
jgi:hypothetical protein